MMVERFIFARTATKAVEQKGNKATTIDEKRFVVGALSIIEIEW